MSKTLPLLTGVLLLFSVGAKCQNPDMVPGNKITSNVMNLSSNKFRNGDTIFIANSDKEWFRAARKGIPAMRYFKGSADKNANVYAIYNWAAVVDARGLAPEGWHIPVYNEINDTNTFLRRAIKYDSTVTYRHSYEASWCPGVYRFNKCWLLQPPRPLNYAASLTIIADGKFLVLQAELASDENAVLCVRDDPQFGK